MIKNNKGRALKKNAPSKTAESNHPAEIDLLTAWLNLGKSSRISCQQKRGWQRGQK